MEFHKYEHEHGKTRKILTLMGQFATIMTVAFVTGGVVSAAKERIYENAADAILEPIEHRNDLEVEDAKRLESIHAPVVEKLEEYLDGKELYKKSKDNVILGMLDKRGFVDSVRFTNDGIAYAVGVEILDDAGSNGCFDKGYERVKSYYVSQIPEKGNSTKISINPPLTNKDLFKGIPANEWSSEGPTVEFSNGQGKRVTTNTLEVKDMRQKIAIADALMSLADEFVDEFKKIA